MTDRLMKGSVFESYFVFIKKKWGPTGLNECCKYADVMPSEIKSASLYEASVSDKMQEWILKTHGEAALEKCGFDVAADHGKLFTYIVRMLDMKAFLGKFETSYYNLFKYGRMNISIVGNKATIHIIDNVMHAHSCVVWRGSMKGMLSLMNKKGTVKETKCQAKGADFCEYIMEWE